MPKSNTGETQATLTVKYGNDLMQGGFTSVPNLALKLFAELGITPTEFVFIEQIWLYWYERQENMFPALSTIADRMNVSRRHVGRYVDSLKAKSYQDKDAGYQSQPYLIVRERYATSGGQLSNQYDFSGFLEAVIYLAKKKGLITDPASGAVRPATPPTNVSQRDMSEEERDAKSVTPLTKTSKGGMTKPSNPPSTNMSTKEDEEEEEEFQEDEESSKKPQKERAEVKFAYSHREHVATRNQREHNRKQTSSVQMGSTPTQKQTPTQRRIANMEAKKQRLKPPIGKPLTQDEIDTNRKQGKNASGLTPLSGILPPKHWPELSTKGNKPSNGNGNGTHYNNSTKNAPLFIDAIIEQFSTLLGDDPENTAQNINRTAKLYREAQVSEDDFRAVMHEALDQAKCYSSGKIKKQRADGRPNRMPVFFTILEERLSQ